MLESWYYVSKGQRLGPVDTSVITQLMSSGQLTKEDFVWKKGFDNWKKIKDVSELSVSESDSFVPPMHPMNAKLELSKLDPDERCVFVRIGVDRGGSPAEYGPYSVSVIKKLFNENRINGRTQFFIHSKMAEWMFLADLADFQSVFEELPPKIEDQERRKTIRKPMLARLFVQNNSQVFEGVCRDISVGGMQVLTREFPGKAGDRISINVHPDNTEYHFTAAGTVVRLLDGKLGFSFRFESLQPDAQRAIEKYIKDVDPAR